MSRLKVVMIEDDADAAEIVGYNLAQEGITALSARGGAEGLRLARRELPDVILLDLALDDMDGIDLCRKLRQDPETRSIPIIIVTAKCEETDVVLGLGVGADDYVTKPFRPKELVARVKAVVRRGPIRDPVHEQPRLIQNGLMVDLEKHEATIHGRPVALTPTELRLLYFLASNPGRVFTRKDILDRMSGGEAVVTERNVDVHVLMVRKKLGSHRKLIQTVRGVGYRFQDAPFGRGT